MNISRRALIGALSATQLAACAKPKNDAELDRNDCISKTFKRTIITVARPCGWPFMGCNFTSCVIVMTGKSLDRRMFQACHIEFCTIIGAHDDDFDALTLVRNCDLYDSPLEPRAEEPT